MGGESIRVGVLLPTREAVMSGRLDAAPLLALAERVEAAGYDSIWVGDSLLARPREQERYYLASQRRLIWWRLKKHRLAMLSLWFLVALYGIIPVVEFLSPYALRTRHPDYVYFRRNVAGVQREWWTHRHGCGAWFLAERDTRTNEVLKVELPS